MSLQSLSQFRMGNHVDDWKRWLVVETSLLIPHDFTWLGVKRWVLKHGFLVPALPGSQGPKASPDACARLRFTSRRPRDHWPEPWISRAGVLGRPQKVLRGWWLMSGEEVVDTDYSWSTLANPCFMDGTCMVNGYRRLVSKGWLIDSWTRREGEREWVSERDRERKGQLTESSSTMQWIGILWFN